MSVIDGYLQRLEEDSKLRVPGEYYVTELCKDCLLSVYYNIKEEVPPTKKMLRIFNSGNLLEDFWVQDVLRNTPGVQVVATQLPARYHGKDFEIHGRIDALTIEGDRMVVRECKTAKTCSWMKEEKQDHRQQLNFYLCALGIDDGVIDYIDKSILLLGEDPRNPDLPPDTHYPVKRDQAEYERMIDTAEYLHQCVSVDMPPEPTVCWMCNGQNRNHEIYCDHAAKCPAHQTPQTTLDETPPMPDFEAGR